MAKMEATGMLRDSQSDLASGLLLVVPADWADVHRLAEELSAKYTEASGHRLINILHVATALHLGAEEFLTFDSNGNATHCRASPRAISGVPPSRKILILVSLRSTSDGR
jgi:hypothetical protein